MAEYDGYAIKVTEFDGNIMGGDTEGVAWKPSVLRYVELLRERLEKEYPGADISIIIQWGHEGACPSPSAYGPGEMGMEDGIAIDVDDIRQEVWGSGKWVVMENAQ
jgi:hypothetical protein